jgi:hypothetical protein
VEESLLFKVEEAMINVFQKGPLKGSEYKMRRALFTILIMPLLLAGISLYLQLQKFSIKIQNQKSKIQTWYPFGILLK